MEKRIRVLVVTPDGDPFECYIENDYKSFQAIVGGAFDVVSTDDGKCSVYCNDMGKLIGLPVCRVRLYKGKLYDWFCGNLVISQVGYDCESVSLTDEEVRRYKEYYSLHNHHKFVNSL